MAEEEIYCLEIEKKFPSIYRNMKSMHQKCNFYKRLAKDMNKELARNILSYQKEILCYEKRIHESGMAALLAERIPK